MSDISRTSLFGKLNNLGYKGLEGATVFCKLRGNPYVELAHWVHQVVQNQDSDLHRLVRRFGIDPGRLATDLQAALDRMPRGSDGIRDISAQLQDAVERAWMYASLQFREFQVRTGHVVLAMVKHTHLRNILMGVSKEFEKKWKDRTECDKDFITEQCKNAPKPKKGAATTVQQAPQP